MVDVIDLSSAGIRLPKTRANDSIPFDEYAAISAVNWSTLKYVATSAKLCRYRVDHPRAMTEALENGLALHVAALEPERWLRQYVAEPDFGPQFTKDGKPAKNTKATEGYKNDLAAWKAGLPPGATVIEPENHAMVLRCVAAIREHRVTGPLMKSGRAEHVITWTDPVTGVKCKARLDFVDRCVVDIKGTRRESVRRFLYDAAELLYHGQCAWYHDGAIAAGVLPADADYPAAIGVQTVEPHDIIPLRMIPETLEAGRNLYRQLLSDYVQCQRANWWPGLAEDFVPWELPNHALGLTRGEDGEAW